MPKLANSNVGGSEVSAERLKKQTNERRSPGVYLTMVRIVGRRSRQIGEIADEDQRENVSRKALDENEVVQPPAAPSGQSGSDPVGGVEKHDKRKVRWDSDVQKFEYMIGWGGSRRSMAVVRQKLGCDHDVSEFYSPPRAVKMAKQLGMKGGVSLDLTVPASNGYIGDFSREHCGDKAMQIINEKKPLFLMLSPDCTP